MLIPFGPAQNVVAQAFPEQPSTGERAEARFAHRFHLVNGPCRWMNRLATMNCVVPHHYVPICDGFPANRRHREAVLRPVASLPEKCRASAPSNYRGESALLDRIAGRH
jgi:hypothetical protein